MLAFQGNEEGMSIFGVGQEPEPVIIARPVKLNFASDVAPEIIIPPTHPLITLPPSGRQIYQSNFTS